MNHSTSCITENRFRFGSGLLVAAAFIGPGTVVTASKAGAEYGCELLWTILLWTASKQIGELAPKRWELILGWGIVCFVGLLGVWKIGTIFL